MRREPSAMPSLLAHEVDVTRSRNRLANSSHSFESLAQKAANALLFSSLESPNADACDHAACIQTARKRSNAHLQLLVGPARNRRLAGRVRRISGHAVASRRVRGDVPHGEHKLHHDGHNSCKNSTTTSQSWLSTGGERRTRNVQRLESSWACSRDSLGLRIHALQTVQISKLRAER